MSLWILALALLPLALALPDEEYFDILDLGKKEWRLVFRGTAHIESSVYSAYIDGSGIPGTVDPGCMGVDWKADCSSHYRNEEAMTNWKGISEVLLGVIHDGAMVKTFRFDGLKSDMVSWFSEKNLLESCYPDMKTEPKNYFSIEGHTRKDQTPYVERRFFINRNYGGCPNDVGWLVALDGPLNTRSCDWENKEEKYPVFKYSADAKVQNWNLPNVTKSADAIVIFVKYLEHRGKMDEYFDLLNTGLREYRLAFRATANVSVPVYDAYLTGAGIPSQVDADCKTTNWAGTCTSHYRNSDALDNWATTGIEEILVGVIDGDNMVQYIQFYGMGSTMENFYSQKYVKYSCWRDLVYQTKNYFSIKGHEDQSRVQRRFFINRNYGGCPTDAGWLAVIDNADTPPCDWEKADKIPQIMYVAGPRVDNWTTGQIKHAQALVIFLKYKL